MARVGVVTTVHRARRGVADTDITGSGVVAIFESLTKNTTLKAICLKGARLRENLWCEV